MPLPDSLFAPLARLHRRRWLLALALGIASAAPLAAQRGVGSDINDGMDSTYRPARPVVICFPPNPPPLDRAISHVALPMPQRFTPPAELATFINEPFYAPLSTWLLERSITEKMRQRLAALRTAETAALTELRTVIEQTRAAEPAVRRRALETLARQQTPRLAALERDAEQIRVDLVVSNYDWRSLRDWTLGEKNTRGDSPWEIASTLRAYAYYQSGLSAAQRRLLREISLELAAAGEDTASAQAAQPFMFFPPEPARVLLRDDLPDNLATSVAAYQTKKSALKKELFDAVYKGDGASFAFTRNGALKSLAEKQTARVAELETLAEEIRRGLALMPTTAVPEAERSPLPPVLTGRIAALLQMRTALQKDTIARVEAVRARHAAVPAQISYSFENEGLKFIVVPRRSDNPANAEALRDRIRKIEAEMSAVADDYGRRFAEVINDSEAIRTDTTQYMTNAKPREIDNAIVAATRAVALRDSEDAYREYRTAVFEPGMSPEQRRLLFSGALEKLDIPLPRGEVQPMRRALSW